MQPPAPHRPARQRPTPHRRPPRRRLALTAAILTAAAAVTVTTATAASTATASNGSGYDQADLQRDLDAVHTAGATGVQASVLTPDGERLTAASGLADTETREPVPAGGHVHLRAGSITKPMVATVVLQLAAEGRLSLDDTVEEHLPGVVAGNGNDGSKLTIRQLLQHTSGLHDYAEELLPPLYASYAGYLTHRYDTYQLEELAAIAMRHPPTFAPGTSWAYSNTGYALAAMLIEQVTGNPWSQEVHERIIQPLGLGHTTTGVGDGPQLPDPHAKNYLQFTPGGPLVDVTALEPSQAAASGSVISTTDDLSRFFGALVGGELLTPQQLAQMQTIVPTQGEAFQGYGLGLAQIPLSCGGHWAHGGDGPGYQTVAAFSGDGSRGIVISVSSRHLDEEPSGRQQAALWQAIDNALCAMA